MNRTSFLFSAAIGLIGLAAVVGCYTGPNSDLSPATRGPGADIDGTEPPPETDGTAADGSAPAEGLPCDVAKVLADACTDCHGAHPRGGAPNALVTYADLVAPSVSDPARSVAEVSLARMRATRDPMPPDGPLGASEIAILEKWVGGKMPKGSCGSKPVGPDGGAGPEGGAGGGGGGDAAAKDAAPDAASVCTSGTTWAPGTPPSGLMLPGKACIGCHSATGGPSFTIAGTVYPTLHEPNGCNGIGGPAMSVLIIDAAGKTHTMPVNAAGNFTRVTGIPMPYKAMVVKGTKTREMKTPQTDGDCNGCHSEQGNHAPGRIMAP
jgi:cytochrome c553